MLCIKYHNLWAFQVVLVIKNPPVSTGDIRAVGLIPGLGRGPGGGRGKPLQYSCLGIPWTEEPGRLQSTGLERVEHKWRDLVHTFLF